MWQLVRLAGFAERLSLLPGLAGVAEAGLVGGPHGAQDRPRVTADRVPLPRPAPRPGLPGAAGLARRHPGLAPRAAPGVQRLHRLRGAEEVGVGGRLQMLPNDLLGPR